MAEPKKVTRIKAKDDTPMKAVKQEVVTKSKAVAPTDKKNVFARIGGYFKGAWFELRQVRWPNRKATWALTLAVIIFSIFFMVMIVLLDTFFKYLFELIIT